MASKEELLKSFKIMIDNLNEVGPYSAIDWGGACQFIFPDLNTGWLVKMKMDGTVESWNEKIDEDAAEGVVEMDSDTFIGILEKTVIAMEAFQVGKIALRKSMDGLIKMMPAME